METRILIVDDDPFICRQLEELYTSQQYAVSSAPNAPEALRLLGEHGYLRRVDADPSGPKGGRPPSPRFLVNPLHPSTEPTQPTQPHPPTGSVGSVGSVARDDTPGSPR